jgi:hypothetical protein
LTVSWDTVDLGCYIGQFKLLPGHV